MFKKALVSAIAITLGASAAHAAENKFTREEGMGVASGAAIGAVVGGPIGALVGVMIGGVMGDSIGTANKADVHARQLEQELIDTRIALAKASERTGGDEMLDQLAQKLSADVMFRTGSSEIDAGVAGKIEELGKLLASHSELEVYLNGFADPRGTPEQNLELSLRRADAVREALVRGGATPEQIRLSAHGEDLTTAAKDDLEAYAWERRVSLGIRPVSDATSSTVAQSR
jgi:outer membrane protein OmpA-like peptidoglycan-associated protein